MVSSAGVRFEIEFQGDPLCWKKANVCGIHLLGSEGKVAEVVETENSSLQRGPLKWRVLHTDSSRPFLGSEDQLYLTYEIAKKIQLIARVAESYNNPSKYVQGSDKIFRQERLVRYHDLPIRIQSPLELEAGEGYRIKVQKILGECLKATFTKLNEPSISELQTRFDEGLSQLKEAELRFDQACIKAKNQDDYTHIGPFSEEKEKIFGNLLQLETALCNRGVVPRWGNFLSGESKITKEDLDEEMPDLIACRSLPQNVDKKEALKPSDESAL